MNTGLLAVGSWLLTGGSHSRGHLHPTTRNPGARRGPRRLCHTIFDGGGGFQGGADGGFIGAAGWRRGRHGVAGGGGGGQRRVPRRHDVSGIEEKLPGGAAMGRVGSFLV